MRLLQCIIAISLSMVLLTAGQTGKVAGRVTDSGTGEPLVGCNAVSYTHLTLPTNREV